MASSAIYSLIVHESKALSLLHPWKQIPSWLFAVRFSRWGRWIWDCLSFSFRLLRVELIQWHVWSWKTFCQKNWGAQWSNKWETGGFCHPQQVPRLVFLHHGEGNDVARKSSRWRKANILLTTSYPIISRLTITLVSVIPLPQHGMGMACKDYIRNGVHIHWFSGLTLKWRR